MTNEQIEQRIEFIIEQQAQFSSDIQVLREVQASDSKMLKEQYSNRRTAQHLYQCGRKIHQQERRQRAGSLMQLARVIGTVVATVKNDSLEGRKLLIIQSLNKNLDAQGKPMVAIDSVGAGVGELVFWCRGKEASFPFKREDTPTDCTIVGIVDSEKHVLSS